MLNTCIITTASTRTYHAQIRRFRLYRICNCQPWNILYYSLLYPRTEAWAFCGYMLDDVTLLRWVPRRKWQYLRCKSKRVSRTSLTGDGWLILELSSSWLGWAIVSSLDHRREFVTTSVWLPLGVKVIQLPWITCTAALFLNTLKLRSVLCMSTYYWALNRGGAGFWVWLG